MDIQCVRKLNTGTRKFTANFGGFLVSILQRQLPDESPE